MILLCVLRQLVDDDEGIENQDDSRDLISIFDCREEITMRIENNEREQCEKCARLLGGQKKGLQAKKDKDSELADGKIHGNGCTG